MRPFPLIAACFVSTLLFAVEDDAPKKRGGFTKATPKPTASDAAPAKSSPKKKLESDPADADEPVKKSSKKKKPVEQEDEASKSTEPSATPAPKRKSKSAGESNTEEKKEAAAEPPIKTTKATELEESGAAPAKREHAPAATIAPEEIAEFAAQSPRVQALLTAALELTKLNLTYTYGSADPAQGGMDCSGAMYHLLRSQEFKDVPRDSSSQYVWARKGGPFFAVVSKSAESFEFKDLKPGDLLFWTGTYETGREIPISHVMLYLGTEKKTRKRVMFGSSDGRSYDGIQRWGVSVFDFKMPKSDPANPEKSKVDFVGYGRIPGLESAELAKTNVEPAPEEKTAATPTPAPKKSSSTRRKH